LRQLPRFNDPNLMSGYDTLSDAGVYAIDDTHALVQTVDILTPIVDDPHTFGEIAAANALSDVYTVGAKPLTALNIVCFPASELGPEIISDIVLGGSSKVREAGAVIVGGHTVKNEQLIYGLSVTGIVKKAKIIGNDSAQPGDRLILTKPLGTGIISTALKAGLASKESQTAMIDSMRTLNKSAAEIMVRTGVTACTAVTGFGLLGHALNISQASRVSLEILAKDVPLLPGAHDYAMLSLFPGGSSLNFEYTDPQVSWDAAVTEEMRMLLCDAQTSGGLLIAVDAKRADELLNRLQEAGVIAARLIGEVVKTGKQGIRVV